MSGVKFKLPLPAFKGIPLPKLAALEKFLPAAAGKEVLALEIGDVWLKAAAVRKGKLTAIEAFMTEGLSDLDVSQKISEFLRRENFKPHDVVLAHPSHNLTVRMLSLPSIDPKEIKDIVDLQAVKQTPYSRDEITSGFQVIDQDPPGYSRVLVAIAQRELAARYFKISELAALDRAKMTASLEGARFWYKNLMSSGKILEDQAAVLLDVDWATTDLHLMSGNKIVFSRSLGLGAKNLMEQGAAVESEFVREIQRSIESGTGELKEKAISQIVLTGVPKPLKDFSAGLVRELNLPCEVISAFQGVSSSLAAAEESAATSFVSVVGLALSAAGAVMMDLTPPDIQMRRNLESRAKDLMFSGTLLVALISVLSIVCVEKIYKRSGYLNLLRRQYHSVQPEAESVERLVAKMKLAESQTEMENGALDVLRDINEVIPPNIILSSFSYNSQEKNVVLRGVSTEMSGVFQFLTTLEGTPSLEQVKTRNVTKRKSEDKELAEFEISANVHGGPEIRSGAKTPIMPPVSGGPEIRGVK